MNVTASQRHTRARRCPICDGADGDPRGKGKRCSGYASSDGKYVHCSRSELAGNIAMTDGSETYAHRMQGSCKCGTTHGADVRPIRAPVVASYLYTDEEGAPLFRVQRTTLKDFYQQTPDGAGGWKNGRNGARVVLYRLRDLIEDDTDRCVYIVEGEKDADTLAGKGYLATSSPMGAGKWGMLETGHARRVLDGREVVIVADRDEPGRQHAAEVYASIRDVVRSCVTLEAPAPHKDVSDLLQAGGALTDLVPMKADTVDEEPKEEPAYIIETASEIAEPNPPLEWLCRGLRLARGSITIVGGYGYSRKTLYAQSVALSVASGTRALGVYSVDHQPALHVDYEQGKRITRERYQRMARAAGVELRDALLSVVTFPRFKLNAPEAQDHLRRLLEETGAKLVILDSLRASVSGVEENSSEIREYIDLVGTECKRVDAAGIIIHHARKPQGEGGAGSRYSLRGSSGIFDVCDSVFIFSGEKGQPTTVDHEKDRLMGTELESFGLTSEDVADGGDERWGLRVVHQEAAQMRQADDAKRAAANAAERIARAAAVEAYVRELPDATWKGTRSALAKQVGGRTQVVLATIGDLISTHRLLEVMNGRTTEALRWVG